MTDPDTPLPRVPGPSLPVHCRSCHRPWKTELGKIEKGVKGIFDAIENGLYDEGIKQRLGELRQREQELRASLKEADDDTPDIHPQVAEIFRQKVERLAASLNDPENRPEATQALRALIEKIVITPGRKRGESFAVQFGVEQPLRQRLFHIAQKGVRVRHRADHAASQNLVQYVVRDHGLLASGHDASPSSASHQTHEIQDRPSAKAWKSLSQTPECDQRRKRAWTAVHLPNTSGRSRQRAALLAIHKIASTNNRLSTPLRPGVPIRPGRWPSIRFHCSSVSVRLLKARPPSTALNQNFNPKGIRECRHNLVDKGEISFEGKEL